MVPPQAHGPDTETFDLSSQIVQYRKSRLGARALGVVMLVVGLGLVAYVIFVLLSRVGDSSLAWEESGVIMAAVGIVVIAVAWPLATEARRYPVSLLVSNSGIKFQNSGGSATAELAWKDPRLKAELVDRRGLPALHRDGTPRNRFALQMRRSNWIPIPQGAFEMILHHAALHGIPVSRRTVRASGEKGTYEDILIRNKAR